MAMYTWRCKGTPSKGRQPKGGHPKRNPDGKWSSSSETAACTKQRLTVIPGGTQQMRRDARWSARAPLPWERNGSDRLDDFGRTEVGSNRLGLRVDEND